mgnify:CR=1 FL=1
MNKKIIISVDGPAGSGKQRIAKYIAKKYNLYHLDSGLLYRRLSKIILNSGIDYKEILELNKFLSSISSISSKNHKNLRKEEIGLITSKLAKRQEVRRFINRR